MGTYTKGMTREELAARERSEHQAMRARKDRSDRWKPRMRRFFISSVLASAVLASAVYLKDKVELYSSTHANISSPAPQNPSIANKAVVPVLPEFTPMIKDGKYVLAGAYVNPLSAKELSQTLTLEGFCATTQPTTKVENGATVDYTRVLLPFNTDKERKGIERHLEDHRMKSTNALEITAGDEQFLPGLGSSVTRYETLESYLHDNGGNIEQLPYYKEMRKAVKHAKRRYNIIDDEKFMTLRYASVWVESRFNPQAVSRVGAAGLSQIFDKEQLKKLGFEGVLDADRKAELISHAPQLFDVSWNLTEGADRQAFLIDYYHKNFGDPYSAEGRSWVNAASNWGIGKLSRNGMKNAPKETRQHIVKVANAYNVLHKRTLF